MTSEVEKPRERPALNAWLVLLLSLLVAVSIWSLWVAFGAMTVHRLVANGVAKSVVAESAVSRPDETSASARAQRFAELGQSGDALGSLNALLTAVAGALVFWAGVMQHRALKHAQDEALEERKARQKQSEDMLKTIQISERAAQSAEVANQLARESYVADQRAWLKLDVVPAGPLYYNENGLNVTMDVHMTNVGKTPALQAFPSFTLNAPAIGVDEDYFGQSQFRKAVESNRSRSASDMGFTLFPGERTRIQMTTSLSTDEVARVTDKSPILALRLVCIATYRLVQDEAGPVRQTGSLYEIRRTDSARPEATAKNRAQTVIFVDDGDVPKEDLRLMHVPIGASIAD